MYWLFGPLLGHFWATTDNNDHFCSGLILPIVIISKGDFILVTLTIINNKMVISVTFRPKMTINSDCLCPKSCQIFSQIPSMVGFDIQIQYETVANIRTINPMNDFTVLTTLVILIGVSVLILFTGLKLSTRKLKYRPVVACQWLGALFIVNPLCFKGNSPFQDMTGVYPRWLTYVNQCDQSYI